MCVLLGANDNIMHVANTQKTIRSYFFVIDFTIVVFVVYADRVVNIDLCVCRRRLLFIAVYTVDTRFFQLIVMQYICTIIKSGKNYFHGFWFMKLGLICFFFTIQTYYIGILVQECQT